MPITANNPGGTLQNLRRGNVKAGSALPAQRVRMPDEASRAALVAHLGNVPRTGRAEELGRLLALALKVLQE